MSEEMFFFTFLMEHYARYKGTTADKVLRQLDELNLTDYVFNMYEMYHVEALSNAYADIDRLIEKNGKK
ncbi:MAG: DUF3791 domain-containing protein [Treponema sp.]|uniref:DUF3791 domain-containing protein n=1 Tax=Treponema sp. TaxID=166 RepID=UPI00298E8994|nr:DUF3791 domain-containing protein [Treponema sp.]MCQ2601969.1 DUF3791 domain-containing protein [Treponema sp.]